MPSMLRIHELSTEDGRRGFDAVVAELRASAGVGSGWHEAAARVVTAVRERGDDAVVGEMRRWTDPDFSAARIRVTAAELDAADAALTGELRGAMERAIRHVREYQTHLLPRNLDPVNIDGAELGLRWTPMDSVGLLVPGGSAVLFSTLIMLAVPALVAGVARDRIAVVSPPPTRREGEPAGDISGITLAVCRMLGLTRVYRIGGSAAVAALALGTQSVEAVDSIAGPGHPVVQAAKAHVRGVVGTDGFYGQSEVTVIADDSADPVRVAADLLAQAEHDPGRCFLIAWQAEVIANVLREMEQQLPQRNRRPAIERALREWSCGVLALNEDAAAEAADRLAAEHVSLAVRDPHAWMHRLRHGGEFFLGDAAPVAAGDYYAGPSHTLPTGTTARYSGGVSVYTFLKRSGTVAYPHGLSEQAIEDIALMAEAEGLDGHAHSVRVRRAAGS